MNLCMSKSENRQLSPWGTILANISDSVQRNMVSFVMDSHIYSYQFDGDLLSILEKILICLVVENNTIRSCHT